MDRESKKAHATSRTHDALSPGEKRNGGLFGAAVSI